MKLPFSLCIFLFFNVAYGEVCTAGSFEYMDDIGIKVEEIGKVPTNLNDAFTYNMFVSDNFDSQGQLFFLDQKLGKIYLYDDSAKKPISTVYDIDEDAIPEGLDLSYSYSAGQDNKILAMAPGIGKNEVYVVFSSHTMPKGWKKPDAPLPPPGAYPGYFCEGSKDNPFVFVRDMYRVGESFPNSTTPECVQGGFGGAPTRNMYRVFYSYKLKRGKLVKPKPFFVNENTMQFHFGGGILTDSETGHILFSTGDCLPFGTQGLYAPQLESEACGSILRINPKKKSHQVVAIGVRNSQQMKLVDMKTKGKKKEKYLVFMDIGGVTSEEVNAIRLSEIMDTKVIQNFGWGINQKDGFAREGTFYIGPGRAGLLGTEPPCEKNAPIPEPGFVQPWIQFGRTPSDFFYGISGFTISPSFKKLKLISTEFNTGIILGTTDEYSMDGPSRVFKIKLFDSNDEPIDNLNHFVQKELGEVGYYRGDPRLFTFPDGTAGVLIERTGYFYKLTEISL